MKLKLRLARMKPKTLRKSIKPPVQSKQIVPESAGSLEREQLTAMKAIIELHREMQVKQNGHRGSLYQYIGKASDLAGILAQTNDEWARFCKSAEWDTWPRGRPDANDRSDPLAHILKFVFGVANEAARKEASKAYRAVHSLFQKGCKGPEIAEYLEDIGGIEVAARAAAKTAKKENAEVVANESEPVPAKVSADATPTDMTCAIGPALYKEFFAALGEHDAIELGAYLRIERAEHGLVCRVAKISLKAPRKYFDHVE